MMNFQDLLKEKISPEEFIQRAEISSSQINSQIIQLIESNPPEEWLESYFNYIESLKKLNFTNYRNNSCCQLD